MSISYSLSKAPVDYQQLWLDMLSTTFEDIDVSELTLDCEIKPVALFRYELLEEMTNWLEWDLQRVVELSDEELLKTLPPLVHTNDFLNDGYHRVAACMLTGVVEYHCVNFSEVVKKLKNGESHATSNN